MRPGSILYLCPTFLHYQIAAFDALARRWPSRFKVVGLRRPNGREERRALGAGTFPRVLVAGGWVPLRPGNVSGNVSGVETPSAILLAPGVVRVLVQERPQVVFVDNFSLWTVSALLAKRWGARVVICWEGTAHTERTVGSRRLAVRRWLARRADAFVVNGTLSRAYVEGLGVAPHRVVEGKLGADVVGIGSVARAVESAWLDSRRRELRLSRPTFLSVSQLVPRKGIRYLVAAVAELKVRGLPASLLVVGDGPERGELEADVQRRGLTDRVHFLRWVPSEQIPWYHRLADAFVLPTLQDNWSIAVVEAMASGLPIVTSVYNGLWPDLVREGENGFVVKPEEISTLADRLAFFCAQTPEVMQRMGARSIELVQRCRADRMAAAYEEAVRVALSG